MSRCHRQLAIAVVAALIIPGPLHAFATMVCDSGTLVRSRATAQLQFAQVSFPLGSPFTDAAMRVVRRWDVNSSAFRFGFSAGIFNSADPELDNGIDEVWFSNDDDLMDEATGRTLYEIDSDQCRIVSADVVFRRDIQWLPGNSDWDPGTGQGSFTGSLVGYGGPRIFFEAIAGHEFGHVIGLQHANNVYNLMGDAYRFAASNGGRERFQPGEDASSGARRLYGPAPSGNRTDVSATHWRFFGVAANVPDSSVHDRTRVFDQAGTLLRDENAGSNPYRPPVYVVGNGQVVNAEFTLENNGRSPVTVPFGMYLSPFSLITTDGQRVGGGSAPLTPDVPTTTRFTVALPSNLQANAIYYVGPVLDEWNAIDEADESNNATDTAIRVERTRLRSITLSPDTVTGPQLVNGTIDLTGAAHAGGLPVQLASSYPFLAELSTTALTVPAGATSASFTIDFAEPLCPPDTVEISATGDTNSVSASLNIVEVDANSFICGAARTDFAIPLDLCFKAPAVPGGSIGVPQRCGSPVTCPECVPTFDRGWSRLPPAVDDLEREVAALLRKHPSFFKAGIRVDEIRKNLAAVTDGIFFDKQARKRASDALAALQAPGKPAGKPLSELARMLNAVFLDFAVRRDRFPALISDGDARFGSIAFVRGSVGDRLPELLTIHGDLPAPLEGYVPVWPSAVYDFSSRGRKMMRSNGSYDVAFNLSGVTLLGSASSVRVLAWDGHSYSDVTTSFDPATNNVGARVNGLDPLLLAVPVSVTSEARSRPGRIR